MAFSLFGRTRRRSADLAVRTEPSVVVIDAPPSQPENPIPQGVRTAAGWAWRALLFAALVWGFGWLMAEFSGVTVPLAIAVLITHYSVRWRTELEELELAPAARGGRCLVVILLIIAALAFGIGATAASQAPALVDQTIAGFNQFMQWLATGPLAIDQAQIDQWMNSLTTWISESRQVLAGYAAKVGASVGHFLAGIAIVAIASFFFLAEGQHSGAPRPNCCRRATYSRRNEPPSVAGRPWSVTCGPR